MITAAVHNISDIPIDKVYTALAELISDENIFVQNHKEESKKLPYKNLPLSTEAKIYYSILMDRLYLHNIAKSGYIVEESRHRFFKNYRIIRRIMA